VGLLDCVFTARRYASAVLCYGPVSICMCLSVCVLLKLLKIGSRKQNHRIAQGL